MTANGKTIDEGAAQDAPITHRRWGIALLLGFGVLVNFFDRINLSVSQDALHREFGISVVTFGYLLSSYSWTYALAQLPTGVLLDRLGVRLVGRLSTFLWSVATFWTAFSTGLLSFFASRLALGVAEAPVFPANAKAVGYWFPTRERGLATALFDVGAKFASAIGVPIVGFLVVRFGWRAAVAFTAVLSLIYFLLFFLFYRNPSEDLRLSTGERDWIAAGGGQSEGASHGIERGSSLLYLLRQRKVLGLSLGFAAYNYTFYLLLTWLPSYLYSELHLDLMHSALYTGVPWLFAASTDLLAGGWLVDHLVRRSGDASRPRQWVLAIGMTAGLAIFGATQTHSPLVALVWISISIGGLAAAAPVAWSAPALIAPPNSVGRVGAIMNFANQLAAIAAPIMTGYIVSATHSFVAAFVAAAAFLLIGIFSYVVLLGRMEPIAAEA